MSSFLKRAAVVAVGVAAVFAAGEVRAGDATSAVRVTAVGYEEGRVKTFSVEARNGSSDFATLCFCSGESAGSGDSTNGWQFVEPVLLVEPGATESTDYTLTDGTSRSVGRFLLVDAILKADTSAYDLDKAEAVWDGLENAGIGVHSDTSTTWKDLVGTRDLTLTQNGSWKSNGLKCSGQSATAATNCTDYMTIEIVLSDVRGEKYVFCAGDTTNKRMVSTWNGIEFGSGASVYTTPLDNVQASAVYTSGSAGDVRTNGYATTACGQDTWGSRGNGMAVGSGYSNTGFPYGGIVHAIRLYKEVLDSETRVLHAKIDRARFFGESGGTGSVLAASSTYGLLGESITVTGSPANLGTVEPGYGVIAGCEKGKSYSFTAPEGYFFVGDAETTRAICTGWRLVRATDDVILAESDASTRCLCTFSFESSCRVEWLWQVEHYLSFAIDRGTLDASSDWYVQGSEMTIRATPPSEFAVKAWNGADADSRSTLFSLSFAVKNPLTISAVTDYEVQIGRETVCVAPGGNDANDGLAFSRAKATIQAAAGAATAGQRVLVSNGVYTVDTRISVPADVLVESYRGATGTTLYVTNGIAVFSLADGAEVRGFTIFSDGASHKGLYAVSLTSKATIGSCVITNMYASGNQLLAGGGTYSNLTVICCTNDGNYGLHEKNGSFYNCRFIRCRPKSGSYGFVLYLPTLVRNCLFAECVSGSCAPVAKLSGGTMECVTAVSNRLENSSAYGAVYATAGTIRNCVFKDNFNSVGEANLTADAGVSVTYTATDSLEGTGNLSVSTVKWGPDWTIPSGVTVDAGQNQSWMTGAVDLSGTARIKNEIVDMGCHEAEKASDYSCWIIAPSGTTGVGESSFTFTAGVSAAVPETADFDWTVTGGATVLKGSGRTYVVVLTPGEYVLTLTVSGDGFSVSDTANVKVVAETVHVAKGSTPTVPYDTDATAFSDLKSALTYVGGLKGVTVTVAPGDYEIDGALNLPENAVVVSSEGPARTTLRGASSPLRVEMAVSGVLLRGFTIDGSAPAESSATALTLSQGTLDGCVVRNFKGASGVEVIRVGAFLVTNCTFEAVSCSGSGDVIYLQGSSIVANSRMIGCSGTGGFGMTLYVPYALSEVRNCLVASCTNVGSAVVRVNSKSVRLMNCTFADNTVLGKSSQSAVYAVSGSYLSNCIAWGNTVDGVSSNFSGAATMSYCCSDVLWPGTGNIAADPLFRKGADYALRAGSPCRDAGDWQALGATKDAVKAQRDLVGLTRLSGKNVDIGCRECPVAGLTLIVR